MKDAEYRHFNAEKHRRNADLDVGCLDARAWFDGPSRGDTGDDKLYDHINVQLIRNGSSGLTYGLPE